MFLFWWFNVNNLPGLSEPGHARRPVGLEPSGIPEFVWWTIKGTFASEEAKIQNLKNNKIIHSSKNKTPKLRKFSVVIRFFLHC